MRAGTSAMSSNLTNNSKCQLSLVQYREDLLCHKDKTSPPADCKFHWDVSIQNQPTLMSFHLLENHCHRSMFRQQGRKDRTKVDLLQLLIHNLSFAIVLYRPWNLKPLSGFLNSYRSQSNQFSIICKSTNNITYQSTLERMGYNFTFSAAHGICLEKVFDF